MSACMNHQESRQLITSDMLTAKVFSMLSAYFMVKVTMMPPKALRNTTRQVNASHPTKRVPSESEAFPDWISAKTVSNATGRLKSWSCMLNVKMLMSMDFSRYSE